MSRLQRDAMEATYDTVKELIEVRVRFFRRYATVALLADDDLTGIAMEAFLEAYLTYRKRKGRFADWVKYVVSRRLRDTVRKGGERLKFRRRGLDERGTIDVLAEPLSDDARRAIDVAMEAVRLKATPAQARRATKKALRAAGWSGARVSSAFSEIVRAIQE